MSTIQRINIDLMPVPPRPERPEYTAVLIAHDAAGVQYVLGSKLISYNDLRDLERSGAFIIRRHFKCPRLLYVIMN